MCLRIAYEDRNNNFVIPVNLEGDPRAGTFKSSLEREKVERGQKRP